MANSRYSRTRRGPIQQALLALLLAAFASTSAMALKQKADPRQEYINFAAQYLTHLAAGNYEAAADMTDVAGLTDLLVRQRIMVLKKQNPEMTQEEVDVATSEIRANQTTPEKMREVIIEMLSGAKTEGMKWEIASIVTPEAFPQARIIAFKSEAGINRKISDFVVNRVGPTFYIAPHIQEQLQRQRDAANRPAPVSPPIEVQEMGDMFWSYWSTGALDQAYDLVGYDMKQALPMLKFLETSQQIISQIGVLTEWTPVSSQLLKANYIRTIYNLDCANHQIQGVLDFKKTGESWAIAILVIPYQTNP